VTSKFAGIGVFLYRAIDRSGTLVDLMFSRHRDMAAAKAFFESDARCKARRAKDKNQE
jgi:transposase-like protein